MQEPSPLPVTVKSDFRDSAVWRRGDNREGRAPAAVGGRARAAGWEGRTSVHFDYKYDDQLAADFDDTEPLRHNAKE